MKRQFYRKKSIILIILLILLLTVHGAMAALTDAKLYLSLDQNNTTVLDLSGNGHNGAVTGATYNATGKVNGSYMFDSTNDFIGVSDHADLKPGTSITYGGWFLYRSHETGNPLSKHNVTTKSGYNIWFYGTSDDKFYCQMGDGSTWPKANVAAGSASASLNTWYHVVCVKNGSSQKIYINGAESGSASVSFTIASNTRDLYIARDSNSGSYDFDGIADEVFLYDRALSTAEIAELYNSGDGYNPYASTTNTTYTFNAIDLYDDSALDGVNFTTESGSCVTSGGTCTLSFETGQGTLNYNVTLDGYYKIFNETIEENATANVYMTPLTALSVSFSNYSVILGNNYTRNIYYNASYNCPSQYEYHAYMRINGTVTETFNLTCDGENYTFNNSYQHPLEGVYLLSLELNETDSMITPDEETNKSINNIVLGNYTFISDLNDPTATINFTYIDGFAAPVGNISLTCVDTIAPTLTYNIDHNGTVIYNGTNTSNVTQVNVTTLLNGLNVFTGFCADSFGNDTDTQEETIYVNQFCFIDERDNSEFDVTNVSIARIYFDDNSTSYDFKTTNASCVNFTSSQFKVRAEIGYPAGTVTYPIVTRWIDIRLLPSSDDVRICANKDDISHYENILVSGIEKAVIFKSVFSNCLVAADYTRFAYQDSVILKGYTSSGLYYLYTYDEESLVYLASIDGSVSTYVNLDTLEFNKEGYNLDILSDSLSFDKPNPSADQIRIYYDNQALDNEELSVTIINMDDDATVYSADVETPNNFTLYFDYTTLNVTKETLFKIILTITRDGEEQTLTRYFNANLSSGTIPTALALAISILLTIFGLTLVASRYALGWFGIIIELMSIGILSFAVITTAAQIVMGANFIIIIYLVITLVQTNYPTVT